jgi:hypothetical protein
MNLTKTAMAVAFCVLAVTSAPVRAAVVVGFSFGVDEVGSVLGSPCDAEPVCDYPRYTVPVFIDGAWYSGPIYYRWSDGVRLFWYRGAWRRDEWVGPRPSRIEWRDWREHGEWRDGWRGDRERYERLERERARERRDFRPDRDRREWERRERE